MRVVATNYEVIICAIKNFIKIITRYFNDNFDAVIYTQGQPCICEVKAAYASPSLRTHSAWKKLILPYFKQDFSTPRHP